MKYQHREIKDSEGNALQAEAHELNHHSMIVRVGKDVLIMPNEDFEKQYKEVSHEREY